MDLILDKVGTDLFPDWFWYLKLFVDTVTEMV